MVIMETLKKYYTKVYSSIRYKAKRRGDCYPDITKQELIDWLVNNGVEDMWIEYLESNRDKSKKPSIDRIDDYDGYHFDNMQLITWRENQLKGVNGKKHHTNSHNRNLMKPIFIYTKSGKFIKKCIGTKDASEYLGCHKYSVSRAITKKRKTIKGFIVSNFALTGEELTI